MRFRLTITTPMLLAALIACGVMPGAARGQSGDPTTFTDQLNAARAARGLAPVAYNPEAVAVARQNNASQMAWGLGHWVCGSFGQCSAVGFNDAASALMAWSNSPSHAAIIYAPSLASVGFDATGNCCTVSTASGYAV